MERALQDSDPAKAGSVQQFIIGLLLFLFLYTIDFVFLPIITSRIVLLLGGLYVALLWTRGLRVALQRDLLTVVGLGGVSFLYALGNYAGHDFSDPTLAKGMALVLLHSAAGGILFAIVCVQLTLDFRDLIRILHGVFTAQAVFIILYFVSMEFRQMNIELIVTHGNIDPMQNFHRARGIGGSFGASLAVMQSTGLLFTAYLITATEGRKAELAYLFLSFVLITASVVVTGRSGLVMLPFVMLYFLLVSSIDRMRSRMVFSFLLLIPLALTLGYFGLKYGAAYFPGNDQYTLGADRFNSLLNWIRMDIMEIDGRTQSYTLYVLMKQWIFPANPLALIFGDPATWEAHRIRSDIGPIRLLFGGGIVGMTLIYGMYAALFASLIKGLDDPLLKRMVIVLCAFLFLVEYKEPFLMKMDPLLFILFFAVQFNKPGVLFVRPGGALLLRR